MRLGLQTGGALRFDDREASNGGSRRLKSRGRKDTRLSSPGLELMPRTVGSELLNSYRSSRRADRQEEPAPIRDAKASDGKSTEARPARRSGRMIFRLSEDEHRRRIGLRNKASRNKSDEIERAKIFVAC